MNYVASSSGHGTILFDEYSYALAKGFPSRRSRIRQATTRCRRQYNVAVALTQAIINQDKTDPTQYLLQDLNNVYDYSDHERIRYRRTPTESFRPMPATAR